MQVALCLSEQKISTFPVAKESHKRSRSLSIPGYPTDFRVQPVYSTKWLLMYIVRPVANESVVLFWKVWIDAAAQVLYSLAMGMGVNLTFASYNNKNNNILK